MAQVTQRGMSHAQMDVSNLPMNAPSHVLLNTNNAKIRVIADGVLVSGRIALVPAIRRDVSHAGMVIKIRQQTTVPMKTSPFHVNAVMHHQIVSNFLNQTVRKYLKIAFEIILYVKFKI